MTLVHHLPLVHHFSTCHWLTPSIKDWNLNNCCLRLCPFHATIRIDRASRNKTYTFPPLVYIHQSLLALHWWQRWDSSTFAIDDHHQLAVGSSHQLAVTIINQQLTSPSTNCSWQHHHQLAVLTISIGRGFISTSSNTYHDAVDELYHEAVDWNTFHHVAVGWESCSLTMIPG